MKGGVAASNIKYHWRRHASGFAKTKRSDIIADGRYEEFTDARGQFDKDLRALWNVFRGLVITNQSVKKEPSQLLQMAIW